MKGRIVLAVIGIALATGVLLLLTALGAPPAFSVSWILLVLSIAVVSRQVFLDDTVAWPPAERDRTVRGSEVSRLAWSINNRTGVAGHVVVRRVQSVLRRRLIHRGLDLDDPAQHARIDALLGPDVRDALHRREVQRSDIERVLDAVDRIPPDDEEIR